MELSRTLSRLSDFSATSSLPAQTVSPEDIRFIVETLNRPPFNETLTLVTFNQLSPLELLQIVNNVFGEIDSKQKRDLRDEATDASAQRMLEFLAVLRYRFPTEMAEFKDAFMRGGQEVIYPMLLWMLNRMDDLKKRAFLARYLKTVDVPEEFFADQVVVTLYAQYKQMQQEFKEVHKLVDKHRGNSLRPQELQAEITQLEQEREQLLAKLASMRKKVANQENFNAILTATHSLRKEQEEESKLYQQIREQRQRLLRAEQIKQAVFARFRELDQSQIHHKDPRELLNRLREEVKQSRALCEEKLEKDLMDREKHLRELERVPHSERITEDEVAHLSGEMEELLHIVSDLTNARDRAQASMDSKVSFLRDRIEQMEKKKERLSDQHREMDKEKKELEDELRRIGNDLQALMVNGQRPMTEAQLKSYMKELSKKTNVYKQCKAQLQAAQDEARVLARTEEVLRQRDGAVEQSVVEAAKARGVEGYQTTQDSLESVSQMKSKLDTTKARSLEEMSKIVVDITNTLKTKKSKLAPMIKELKTVRTSFEAVEAEYKEKKRAYDNIVLGLESERMKLEQEVESLKTGTGEEQSTYHFLNSLNGITQVRLEQMAAESAYASAQQRMPGEYKSYSDMYAKMLAEQEARARMLRQERETVQMTFENHKQQRAMFESVLHVMDAKLRSLREQMSKSSAAAQAQMLIDEANVMVFE